MNEQYAILSCSTPWLHLQHVTEPMRQDPGANSSTSTRGPWSGHQIIPYWLSDAWKIKDSVAVMTADTVRIH